MNDKPNHHVVDGIHDPAANYSLVSIIAHWIGALAVIALFLTHEDDWIVQHISIGIIFTIPLFFRVVYRVSTGFPRTINQHPLLNLLSRLVMIGMLLSILITTVSGILLPLFAGVPYPFFDIASWKAPYDGNSLVHSALEEAHDLAGHAIVPLFVLHLLGFFKHLLFDKHGNRFRMLKAHKGGK